MKRIFFCALILTATNSAIAQHQFGFSAGAGISQLKSKSLKIDNDRGVNVTSRPQFSTGAAFVYRYDFGDQFIETGLNYNYMNGVNWQEFDKEKHPTHGIGLALRDAHYINIPVTLNFRLADFTLGVGASAGFAVFEQYGFSASSELFADYFYYDEKTIERFDFGLNGQIGYDITNNFTIQCKGYFGLQDIGSDVEETQMSSVFELEKVNRPQRNRQLTIGVKYMFGG
ncbi:MAG: outer membrane beta-barrel protein [Crocinitomix sp.]|nr:outer membrane beta-barrel protein [Crocinitomix sp.]